jgi:hypothetical protein
MPTLINHKLLPPSSINTANYSNCRLFRNDHRRKTSLTAFWICWLVGWLVGGGRDDEMMTTAVPTINRRPSNPVGSPRSWRRSACATIVRGGGRGVVGWTRSDPRRRRTRGTARRRATGEDGDRRRRGPLVGQSPKSWSTRPLTTPSMSTFYFL